MRNRYKILKNFIIGGIGLGALYLASIYNYLLFHSLAEMFSIVVAVAIFLMAWNAWAFTENGYLKYLGMSLAAIAVLDVAHTLAYAGMNIFPEYDANLPTQLWIAARYLQALALISAPFFIERRVNRNLTVGVYLSIAGVLLASIFARIFPDCYIVGSGLTPFKVVSEYVISLILIGAIVLLHLQRKSFGSEIFRWLVIAIALTIGAELAFTFYIGVYDLSNLLGHFFKILAYYYIYKAIIEIGLTKPYNLLFRNLKQQEEQLIKAKQTAESALHSANAANQAKDIFLANMSYELRSPLNVILGLTEELQRSQNFSRGEKENLLAIHHSGEHLLDMIDKILASAKAQAGKATLTNSDFDLYKLLDEVELMFTFEAQKKQLGLKFERSASVGQFIYADKSKLRQVLVNLLSNAIKYTQSGSISVRVSTASIKAQSRRLQIEVEDSGPGISTEERERIFEPFQQSQSGRDAGIGTGLGLSISRDFVRLMGGEISLESEPGAGSKFIFAIPLKLVGQQDEHAYAPEKRRVTGLAPGQPRYRILIADDQQMIRWVMERYMAPLGFELRQAADGQEAIDTWEVWQPHLVWMDMQMPVLDGYESTQRIKASPLGRTTKIIALSGGSDQVERSMALAAGCDDYIKKPIRIETVHEMIAKHLGVEYIYEDKNQETYGEGQ